MTTVIHYLIIKLLPFCVKKICLLGFLVMYLEIAQLHVIYASMLVYFINLAINNICSDDDWLTHTHTHAHMHAHAPSSLKKLSIVKKKLIQIYKTVIEE